MLPGVVGVPPRPALDWLLSVAAEVFLMLASADALLAVGVPGESVSTIDVSIDASLAAAALLVLALL